MRHRNSKTVSRLLCGSAAIALSWGGLAKADEQRAFNIEAQPLATALMAFGNQSGHAVMAPMELMEAKVTRGFQAPAEPEVALAQLLEGTGLTYTRTGDTFAIVQGGAAAPQSQGAAGDGADGTVEALIVTAQKREEDIQDVPIAISAFTQEQLERSQIAGGPDLMTQIPNMTFTKTNFSSYSIQIRGIGTQAISATVDPAVAVAFNNTPFVRNRFFEQEFYDLQRVEVLRGPQGTLYGRNATAGVVNIISAKPGFRHEAKLSADIANYKSTRLEGMINIPLVDDIAALRLAGAWTKRDGYVTNQLTGNPIDGRDLWSTRLSLRVEPTDSIRANLIWEHFEEDDDRLRSGKQLCKKDMPSEVHGIPLPHDNGQAGTLASTFTQGCLPASMYSDEAFQTPNGFALPYYAPLAQIGLPVDPEADPYLSATQSRDLRVIESSYDPAYKAKSDLAQILLEADLSSALTLSSETAYSRDFVFSTQDFNRFATRPGVLLPGGENGGGRPGLWTPDGFCDPQIGCTDRLALVDLSTAKSTHFSQEFRLSSDFEGAFNFSLGANFLRYDTEDKYYVFANTLSLWAANASWTGDFGGNSPYDVTEIPYVSGVTDNSECLQNRNPADPTDPRIGFTMTGCIYIDPNPIGHLNDLGHNYFLSKNPYRLISYAAFGEVYYNLATDLKVTAGLRWTVDKKQAPLIPSWLIVAETIGYPVLEIVKQEWREPTGRLTLDWKPDLALTDETLLYASYARGYKAGGMNPPPAVLALYQSIPGLHESLKQPKTFEAEFVDAFELGAKNTFLDGRATLNISSFYYDYENYQLSQIINRSAETKNFDAAVWGIEFEADWRPLENLRLGLKAGYQNTRVADGESAIDLMDRTAGNSDWVVMRPFPTIPSNCIAPVWLVTWGGGLQNPGQNGFCADAYLAGLDPVTSLPYEPDPQFRFDERPLSDLGFAGYPGFNPASAPNNGEGFSKDLGGNELPNAPHFTTTVTADYTLPLPNDWLMTLHADYYHQSKAWTRIFNFDPYDRLKPYTNVNLAAVFTNEDAGWKVMAYVKNVFDTDAITGAFLNSDDTGLTTNVFLLEPRLYGLRVTKEWTGTPLWGGLSTPATAGPFPWTVELAGQVQRHDAPNDAIAPAFTEAFSTALDPLPTQQEDLDWGDGREIKVTYQPSNTPWRIAAGARFGKTNGTSGFSADEIAALTCFRSEGCTPEQQGRKYNYVLTSTTEREEHTIVDFSVGRDFGLGSSATPNSTVSFGVRYAEFQSSTLAEISGIPDFYARPEMTLKYPTHWTQFVSETAADREFEGLGPVLSWDASLPLLGSDETGRLNLEWSLGGGVLFGKQQASNALNGTYVYSYVWLLDPDPRPEASVRYDLPPDEHQRSRSTTVPTANASLGLSYAAGRIKLGAGYRWERYFDALDGGYAERSEVDRTIDGPYFKLSIGFGG